MNKSYFRSILFSVFAISTLLSFSSTTFAWGERGHHEICAVATRLVKNPELKKFLNTIGQANSHMMGHLCNIPDIYWKQSGDKPTYASHFIDIDALPMTPEETPLDLMKIVAEHDGKFNKTLNKKINIITDYGTLWWRYDQFYRLALAAARKSADAAKVLDAVKVKPALANDTNVDKKDYNKAVLQMITYMGLMGHYIGDASMPYHNTHDYDGWHSQHGGIHSYYEADIVNELPLNFEERMFKAAKNFANSKVWKETKNKTPIEIIKKISTLAYKDLGEIRKLDKVLATSAQVQQEGSKSKHPAKRKSAADMAKTFENLIIKQTAWSAVALSETWDKIYSESGKFDLTLYKSYDYPITPEFVPLDYGPKSE